LDEATVVAHRRVESAATAQVSVFCPQCQDNLPAFANVPTDDSRPLLSPDDEIGTRHADRREDAAGQVSVKRLSRHDLDNPPCDVGA
jgi:hypothetical protein